MKNEISREELQRVCDKFGLGNIRENNSLEDGLVNLSFKVQTSRGNFVVQSLSPIFDERAIKGYEEVQKYLRTNGVHVPVLLDSKEGLHYYRNGEYLWRAFEYVPNKRLEQTTPKAAYEIAKNLRSFHELMRVSDFRPEFKIEGFHETKRIIEKLKNCFNKAEYADKAVVVEEERDFILDNIEKHYLPEDLPKTLIHGDPKPQNFLFDENENVVSMLDLDTIMEGSELLDLGDGFRSWCEMPDKSFRKDIFEAGLRGYFSLRKELPYGEEMIKKAVGLITLELAARFLIDSFEESYFRINAKKYKSLHEQGMRRCQGQIQYYQNFSREFAKRSHFG